MGEARDWIALIDMITRDPSVAGRMERYLSDPDGYVTQYIDELALRGIDTAENASPIVVLVDALAAAGELAYVDWKSPIEVIVGLLSRVPLIAATNVNLELLEALNDDEEPGVELAVGHVNALLAQARAGVLIAILDEDSDAYPLVAVHDEEAAQLVAAAAGLDIDVRIPRTDPERLAALAHESAAGLRPDASSATNAPAATGGPVSDQSDRSVEPAPRDRRVDVSQLLEHIQVAEQSLKGYRRALPAAVRAGYGKQSRVGTAVPADLATRLRAGYAAGEQLPSLAKQVSEAARTYSWTLKTAEPLAATEEDWAMYLTFEGNSELVLASVELLSWAVALGDTEAVESIVAAAAVPCGGHPMISRLASLAGVDADTSGDLEHPEFWQSWLAVLDRDEASRASALANRVSTWPSTTWKHWIYPPDDSRYSGQFCFDAAPLAVCLDIDDSAVRDLPDYPSDLVDFAREYRSNR